jgi:hypothetical protein
MVLGQCILLYLELYLIYYKSLYGCRQVAEPPKIMCVVSFYFGSVFALFYHPNNLKWTEIHRTAKFDAIPLLSPKLFLHHMQKFPH